MSGVINRPVEGRYIKVYVLTFNTYANGIFQINSDCFDTMEAARREKKILESCGNTNVKIWTSRLQIKR